LSTEAGFHPLTYPQQSIWFLEKLNPGTGIGNIAATMKIDEILEYGLMNQAVNLLLKRNDGFRIRFAEQSGKPMQYFSPLQEYRMDYHDFSRGTREKLYAWDQYQTTLPFEILDADLFYFALLKIDDASCGFFVRIHHLISDAWSLVQLGNEVLSYYRMLQNNQPIPADGNPSYLEYMESEQAYLHSEKYDRDRAFWNTQFAKSQEPTTLKSRASARTALHAKRKSFIIPDKLAKKMKAHCSENRTSMFALFFSALCIYINRVKNNSDITIGTPVLNRTNAREKKTIGMFISTVPLRIPINGELNFIEFSKMVDKQWLSVLKHQKYPYDHLLKDARAQNSGVDKLFDIAISYQNAKMNKDDNQAKLEARWHFNEHQVESLYMHINDRESDGRIILNYDFLTEHFFSKEIEFMHDHIIRLLWHALDNPTKKLADIHMLSEKEWAKVLFSFNDGMASFPRDATIAQLFEEQAERIPEATALVLNQDTMTYGELNEKANILAGILRTKGVGPEVIVGMLVPRTFEMIIGILGIVKAGGAYLPMDPDYPKSRIEYMLEDSRTNLLLSRADLISGLNFNGEILDIYKLLEKVPDEKDTENPVSLNQPKDLLYVIYTSGSTGKPKGAMIEHANVVRLLFNDQMQFDFGQEDCWTLFHSYCFDFSVWEMYGALLYGGRLVIVPKNTAQDTDRFLAVLKNEQVTVLNQTPGAFYNLVDADRKRPDQSLCLRYVIFGGEALKPVMLKPFRTNHPETKLINMYGITETTVHVTYIELSDEDIASNVCNIGRPIPTTTAYILDGKLNPLPIGVAGEICVGGDGVGRGYLNNDSLTAEKFVPNPFVPGEIMYRSGDLARFYSQGDMEYLGRIDSQIKIRGHRIELGEIESAMLLFGKIREVTVITRDGSNGIKQMISYYIPCGDFELCELREFLAVHLPEYMMPAYFIKMDKIPLNDNGKVDRLKLPLPDQSALAQNVFVAPRNDSEESIARIWREVLEIGKMGINDNFFQLGGDSLSAVTAIGLMGRAVTFSDLYNNPTIASLSDALALKAIAGTRGNLLLRLSGNDEESNTSIICFPYGGGNGIVYKDLADSIRNIAVNHNVYAVHLPGREAGDVQELEMNSTIVAKLVEEIKETIAGEIILYGHCVGSALTIATANQLKQDNIAVKGVFLGGILPPGNVKLLGKDYDPWKMVSNGIIMKYLGLIGLPKFKLQKEYLDIMVKSFRHDARNYYRFFYDCELYQYDKLDVPIHCIIGEKDPITRNYGKRHRQWSQYARGVTLSVIKNAKHYFIRTDAEELAKILTRPD
jgi:amino acid adenylation domain-containing protein